MSAPDPWITDDGDLFCLDGVRMEAPCFTFIDHRGRIGNAHFCGEKNGLYMYSVIRKEGE